MKKKILASLLAVCMFVGMAVPAFASTTSSKSGDSSEVTSVVFAKTEYTIPKDGAQDFKGEVKAFASKSKLVLDPNLSFELADNNAGVFGIDGANVSAVEKTGTATLIVKNIDDKKVGSVKIIAGAATPAKKPATGFRYVEKSYNVPVASVLNAVAVAAPAADFSIEIAPTPTGTVFSPENKTAIQNAVEADLKKALNISTVDTAVLATKGTLTIDVTDLLVALEATKTVVIGSQTVATGAVGGSTPTIADIKAALTGKDITVAGVVYNYDAASTTANKIVLVAKTAGLDTVTAAVAAAACKNDNTTSPVALVAAKVIVVNGKAATTTGSSAITFSMHDDNIKATISGKALIATLVSDANALNKDVETLAKILVSGTTTEKDITSKCIVKAVAGKVAIGITAPSTIKIEVGEVFDLAAKVKHVASDANIKAAVSYDEDYLNNDATDYDFAIVTGGDVTGVAVGKNKVVSKMTYTNQDGKVVTKTAETIVEVVPFGSLPKPTDAKPTTPTYAKMVVGGTYKIAVLNAGTPTTFKTLTDKIVTVDKDGNVKAIAAGTGKIEVMSGTTPIWVNVVVTAAPVVVNPTTKPTTPPQTGISLF